MSKSMSHQKKAERMLSAIGIDKATQAPDLYIKQHKQIVRNLLLCETLDLRSDDVGEKCIVYHESIFDRTPSAQTFAHMLTAMGIEHEHVTLSIKRRRPTVRFVTQWCLDTDELTRETAKLVADVSSFDGEYKGWSVNYDFLRDRLSPESKLYIKPLLHKKLHFFVNEFIGPCPPAELEMTAPKPGMKYLPWINDLYMSRMSEGLHETVMTELRQGSSKLVPERLGHFEDTYFESVREIFENNYYSTFFNTAHLAFLALNFAERGDMLCATELGIFFRKNFNTRVTDMIFGDAKCALAIEVDKRVDATLLYRSMKFEITKADAGPENRKIKL
jgi:hypothetical protein